LIGDRHAFLRGTRYFQGYRCGRTRSLGSACGTEGGYKSGPKLNDVMNVWRRIIYRRQRGNGRAERGIDQGEREGRRTIGTVDKIGTVISERGSRLLPIQAHNTSMKFAWANCAIDLPLIDIMRVRIRRENVRMRKRLSLKLWNYKTIWKWTCVL
jgi:hypothetical protein